ncbi:hypothetical protein EWF20_04655 [Sulfolobus sp. S-194]|uniref:hypothetical protein n=1 Tax=Sulfolobus sp. S-194 TaxID=2512240 RepID=UPI00143710AC|nr:hypothetical protein [Sulfolobus sp. S-194]QIW23516.1 hypothetical protein EWF20_04655 [Sulfolobus sp. S-194]
MNKLATVIIGVLLVGIIAGVLIFSVGKANIVKANNSNTINYRTLGTIKIYNVSALTPFLSNYVNSSYVKLASDVVEYGILNFIKINTSKGVIGYFRAGPLSSLAFYQINSTLTSHGFKYAEYKTLLYDYNSTTAVGFDGNYFYLVHQNSSNKNLTITLLYYLYTSNKTFSPSSTNIIASGAFNKGNFTAYSKNSSIIIQGYFSANYNNLTKILRFFNFTTTNFTVEGKIIFENSTVAVYSITMSYNNKSTYVMIGFREINSSLVYSIGIISSQEISESEVLSLL